MPENRSIPQFGFRSRLRTIERILYVIFFSRVESQRVTSSHLMIQQEVKRNKSEKSIYNRGKYFL